MHLRKRAALTAIIPTLALMPFCIPASVAAQDATPTVTYSCEIARTASPMAGMDGMAMGTPAAAGDHDMTGVSVEFDQLYIDMMIPHHASIIALAQAARDRLTDERLVAIAENIITTQEAEIDELRDYREQFYGSHEPAPVDQAMPDSSAIMPVMEGMVLLIDSEVLVATFCASEEPDLTFIDLTLPHHQMAIMASEAALTQATHEEIRAVAERVMRDQQQEIDALTAIHQELAGEATPATS